MASNIFVGIINNLNRIHKNYGLKGVLNRAWIRLYFYFKDVDFSKKELEDINENIANKTHGIMFAPTTKHGLEISIGKVYSYNKNIFKGTFIDYGSGKGLTLYTAYKLGFKHIIGVEFVKEFCNISLNNMKKLLQNQDKITIIHNDASIIPPPVDTTVIFFFNPFDDIIMSKVIQNIKSQNFENTVYIIYYNPVYRDLYLNDNDFTLINTDKERNTDIYCLENRQLDIEG